VGKNSAGATTPLPAEAAEAETKGNGHQGMTVRQFAAPSASLLVLAAALSSLLLSSLSLRGSVLPTLRRSSYTPLIASVAVAESRSGKDLDHAPRPPPFTFSACLILQDDNKILPEWLAYHYHFLPLRHLVVSADRGNVTSPEHIFDQWRALGMRIDVWPGETEGDHVTGRHRRFIPKCLSYLQDLNRTWTLFVDTDEYIVFNRVMENEPLPKMCIREYRGKGSNTTASELLVRECADRLLSVHRRPLPKVGDVTAADYIHDTGGNVSLWDAYPCVTFPRVFFGARESTDEEVSRDVPAGFNGTAFQTLRYRKFAFLHKPGKSIVDATRYDGRGYEVHRVMMEKCSSPTPYPSLFDALFRVHHYTPSLQVFLSRPNDSRRDEKDYALRTNFEPQGADDGVRGWLSAFVRSVGTDNALDLTERAIAKAFSEDAKIKEELMKERGQDHRRIN